MDVSENGYTMSVSEMPDGTWYWNCYPKLKKPQGPYSDSHAAAEAAKTWARSMPTQNWK